MRWNLAGFYFMLSQFIACIVLLPVYLSRSTAGRFFIYFTAFAYCFFMLVWWTLGFLYRFSRGGQKASGNNVPHSMQANSDQTLYQYHTGYWMYLFYILSIILILTSCLGSTSYGVWWFLIRKKRNLSQEPPKD